MFLSHPAAHRRHVHYLPYKHPKAKKGLFLTFGCNNQKTFELGKNLLRWGHMYKQQTSHLCLSSIHVRLKKISMYGVHLGLSGWPTCV